MPVIELSPKVTILEAMFAVTADLICDPEHAEISEHGVGARLVASYKALVGLEITKHLHVVRPEEARISRQAEAVQAWLPWEGHVQRSGFMAARVIQALCYRLILQPGSSVCFQSGSLSLKPGAFVNPGGRSARDVAL